MATTDYEILQILHVRHYDAPHMGFGRRALVLR
jgi:hypothetical protein